MAAGYSSSLCVQEGDERPPTASHVGRDVQVCVVYGSSHSVHDEPTIIQVQTVGHGRGDETYVGGKRRGEKGRPGINSKKQAVFSVVQRNGDVRPFHVERVTAENLMGIIRKNVGKGSVVMTDGFTAYEGLGSRFETHGVINHNAGEYSRKEKPGLPTIHTNTAEGVFSILKRGLTGVYHQVMTGIFRVKAECPLPERKRCDDRDWESYERICLEEGVLALAPAH
jgi:transposase-like protein